jgi:hypothetical protein
LGVLTFGVEQFSVLFVLGGRSAWARRTVRVYSVLPVFFVFLLGFAFDPIWFWFFVAAGLRTVRASVADGPWPARTVRPVFADGSFFSGRFWWFCSL